MYASSRSGSAVELIDAKRKNTTTGEGWQSVGRMLIGETHHYTLVAAICTLRLAFVPIIPTTFDTIALALSAVTTVSPRRNPSFGGYEGMVKSRSQVYRHRASVQRRRAGWDAR